MESVLIEAEQAVLPGGVLEPGPVYVMVEGARIAGVFRERSSAPVTDYPTLRTHLLCPGFVDTHTHGLGGAEDVVDFWLHPEHSQQLYPRYGTTSFLATVVLPRDHPGTPATLAALNNHCGKTGHGAVLEGIHAEGPVVNDLGGLPPSHHDMSLAQFQRLLDSMSGVLRTMTISPHLEAPNNYLRIQALVNRGILPALGHDRVASEIEILGALSTARPGQAMHITHLFNVSSFHHRQPSLVNFGLTEKFPSLPQYRELQPPTVEVIGDLTHLHPLTVSVILRARSFKNICFVTDSVSEPTPGQVIRYLDRELQVSPSGHTMTLVGSDTIAGSCCTMLDILQNLVHVLNVPVGQAVAMLSENPARIVGLKHVGSIESGKRADFCLLDEQLNLQHTMVAGRLEYTASTTEPNTKSVKSKMCTHL